MMYVVHLPCLKKKILYFFPLGTIIWGSHQPYFFVLIPMETAYVFFLGTPYDLKTHKSNLEVSFTNKAIFLKQKQREKMH